ncbi:MAG: ATP-binding protein [Sideroxyarcus sp.]|nr:ATP-binding protein [Sideroxyarcus sp.]
MRIKTPPVTEACERVLEAFSTGCGSSMLVGRPRLGKTFAARWICQSIKELMGPLYWYEVSFEKPTRPSESGFFAMLLKSVDHKYLKSRRPRDLRDRIGEFMIERASESPSGTVILMLDEAQNLTDIHWTWLAELSNTVDKAGYSLFTLSTGQKTLYVTRNSLQELASDRDNDFIIGRFFLDMNNFRGLRTEEDLRLTYREYDNTKLDTSKGISWVESALPIAYRAGWRLENLSSQFWSAYCEVWKRAGRNDSIEIPMTYFDLLVRQILGDSATFNVEEPAIGFEQATEMIARSQFAKSI